MAPHDRARRPIGVEDVARAAELMDRAAAAERARVTAAVELCALLALPHCVSDPEGPAHGTPCWAVIADWLERWEGQRLREVVRAWEALTALRETGVLDPRPTDPTAVARARHAAWWAEVECRRAAAPPCAACGGSGYAVNCGPRDRERGDLWACGACDGTGRQ